MRWGSISCLAVDFLILKIMVYLRACSKENLLHQHPQMQLSSFDLHCIIRIDIILYLTATTLFLTGFISIILVLAMQGDEREFTVPFISDSFDRGASRAVFRTFISLTNFCALLSGFAIFLIHLYELDKRTMRGAAENDDSDNDSREGRDVEQPGNPLTPDHQNGEGRYSTRSKFGDKIDGKSQPVAAEEATDEIVVSQSTERVESGGRTEEQPPSSTDTRKRGICYYVGLSLPLMCLAAICATAVLFILVTVFHPTETAHPLAFAIALAFVALWGLLLLVVPLSIEKDGLTVALSWAFWTFILLGGVIMGVGWLAVGNGSLAAGGEYVVVLAATGFLTTQGYRLKEYRIVMGI